MLGGTGGGLPAGKGRKEGSRHGVVGAAVERSRGGAVYPGVREKDGEGWRIQAGTFSRVTGGGVCLPRGKAASAEKEVAQRWEGV